MKITLLQGSSMSELYREILYFKMKKSLSMLLGFIPIIILILAADLPSQTAAPTESSRYLCEEDLIEIMFTADSKVRLRGGVPVDLPQFTRRPEGENA